MNSVCNFIKEIQQDRLIIKQNTDTSMADQKQRIKSVRFRVLGTLTAVLAVGCFITSAVTLLSIPPLGIGYMITSVALAVFAHDFIKIGINLKKTLNTSLNSVSSQETVYEKVCRVGNGIWDCAKAGFNVMGTSVPYPLLGTILFEPLYKMDHC